MQVSNAQSLIGVEAANSSQEAKAQQIYLDKESPADSFEYSCKNWKKDHKFDGMVEE